MSSLDNLAQYRWASYQANPISVTGLGWPLHAMGDAAAPHHVTGTTSWGHRPFEDAAERYWSEIVGTVDDAKTAALLRIGFDAWKELRQNPSIQSFIENQARWTRSHTPTVGGWAFRDELSTTYFLGLKSETTSLYQSAILNVRPLVEHGVGRIIGFLVQAGEIARDPGIDPSTQCGEDSHYTGAGDDGCEPGPGPPRDADTDAADLFHRRGLPQRHLRRRWWPMPGERRVLRRAPLQRRAP